MKQENVHVDAESSGTISDSTRDKLEEPHAPGIEPARGIAGSVFSLERLHDFEREGPLRNAHDAERIEEPFTANDDSRIGFSREGPLLQSRKKRMRHHA